MDPVEREDSSKYLGNRPNQFPPTPEADLERPPQQPMQPARLPEPPKKKNKAPIVLGTLLVLALIGAGVLGWLWTQESARADTAESSLASANQEVRQLKAKASVDTKEPSESDTIVEADTTDSEEVVAAALAYAKAEKQVSGVTAKLAVQSGDFARVTISTVGAGYSVILKKSDTQWVVITSGQAAPEQEVIDRYGIPMSVIES